MDLRHMRQFVAVAEELHFGRAAQRLNIAQPPLSQAIRRLEADLGVELFDRSRRSVELTAAGRIFLVEARRTLQHAELAQKMVQREAAKPPETRVSFVGPALYRVLPAIMLAHRAAAPNIAVRLFEAQSPAQIVGILSGEYDVAFVVHGTALSSECESLVVERARLMAAVPADSALAAWASISVAQLAEQPFIAPPSRYARVDTLGLFKRVGVMPDIVQEATQTNTALGLVGAGLGCSLVMATAMLAKPSNVKLVHVEDLPTHQQWELLMVWHAERIGRLANHFLATAKAYVRDNLAQLGLTAESTEKIAQLERSV